MNEENINEEEWNFYLKIDGWTLREAILLLEGKSPSLKPPYSKFYRSVEELAIRSNEAGLLNTICGGRIGYSTDIEVRPKPAKHWYHSTKPLAYDEVFYTEEVVTEAGVKTKINPVAFLRWAIGKGLPINDRLNTLLQYSIQKEGIGDEKTNLRQSVIDKEKVQAIALCLWDNNLDTTIEDIIKHPWVLKFGNGAQYTGKNTLRSWVREVDPRPKSMKKKPTKANTENTPEV